MVNTLRLFIIMVFILFFSCSTKNEENIVHTDSLLPIEKNTTKAIDSTIVDNSNSSIIEEDSSISDSIPKPVKLPFNAHYGYSEMSQLVKKSPNVYRLPHINKINFIITDSSYGNCTDHKGIDTNVFKFKKYHYKLPDIQGYESYIVCDTTFSNYGVKYPFHRCGEHYILIHGYLILYNPLNKNANIILLYYQNYPSNKRRTFDIDKNYEIHLLDYNYFEPDEDNTTPLKDRPPLFKYTVKINSDGSVKTLKKRLTN